jgi:hypothetical protein
MVLKEAHKNTDFKIKEITSACICYGTYAYFCRIMESPAAALLYNSGCDAPFTVQ